MESSDAFRIAIDSILITFLALWISFCSELGFLKRLFFAAGVLLSALLLLFDICVVLIVRVHALVAGWPAITERLYLIKIAVLLNMSAVLGIFLVCVLPSAVWERVMDSAVRTLFFSLYLVRKLRSDVVAIKHSMRNH